jgi:Ca2+-binding RTX toxin-like protein
VTVALAAVGPVTLPDGLPFADVLKVVTHVAFSYTIRFPHLKLNDTINLTETTWYARGVGEIKDQIKGTEIVSDGKESTKENHNRTSYLSGSSLVHPDTTLASGVLTVHGTRGKDVIVVEGGKISFYILVNGIGAPFTFGKNLRTICVDCGSGDDKVRIDGAVPGLPGTGVPGVSVLGGGGNDIIKAGDGNDTITGGPGSNTIYGGGGNDLINGAGVSDLIFGGYGNDTIHGNGGDDTIYGDAGNDQLWGGGGNDSIVGSSGQDSLFGEAGNDTLSGGTQTDRLDGGADFDAAAQYDLSDELLNIEQLL